MLKKLPLFCHNYMALAIFIFLYYNDDRSKDRQVMAVKLKKDKLWKIPTIVICAVLFGLLAADIRGAYVTAPIDVAAYHILRTFQSNAATGFFKLMTNMVHPVVLLVISLSMIHILKQRKYLVALLGNLILTVLLNLAIKGSFMRVRPPEEMRLIMESGYSFPSGHAMVAASFYGFLVYMLKQADLKKGQKWGFAILYALVVLLVGCSRIYLGVHYATDVIGGFCVSVIYLILYTEVISHYFAAEASDAAHHHLDVKQELVLSFAYAFRGIFDGIKNERNMMIHYSAVVLVVVFGITLKLTVTEWGICLVLCGMVIALEQVNTAIEAVVDLVTEEHKELARLAKDTAAGAVLVAAITAAIVGGLIFFPKLMVLFGL